MFTKKRHDGTYLKNLHFFTQMLPYLMPTRSDAVIYFETEFDVTDTLKFISEKRRSGSELKISMFYLILYAAVRVIAQRPKMNRFVSGHRYYQRNRITFNFVAKREMSDDGEEVNVTMSFSPLLTLEGFCKKINDHISNVKKGEKTDSEKTNSFFTKLPRFIVKFAVWGLKYLDYHNGIPKSILNSLPFWCTIFFTNTGSVGIDAPFHHNFEIGNCGIFCAIGKVRKENILNSSGIAEKRDKVKITFTYDDRITDGIYCARAIDMVKDLVESPEKLEVPLVLTQEQIDYLKLAKSELEQQV
ncbi:MAG: 2-oxo acid dehydrogenase subunit E2 [Treponema sp.]|nr:2-oxo acid dehydrogenase subunit E2 [Treponema sp.]